MYLEYKESDVLSYKHAWNYKKSISASLPVAERHVSVMVA